MPEGKEGAAVKIIKVDKLLPQIRGVADMINTLIAEGGGTE